MSRCLLVLGLALPTLISIPNRSTAAPLPEDRPQCVSPSAVQKTANGPDVVTGQLIDARLWGTSGDLAAFSIGTVACNAGSATVSWLGQSNQHPVVSQALYRLKDGRMQQIGMAWLKHGFIAGAENACGLGCQNPGTFFKLGIGCSDPYDSPLNGEQRALGPRSDFNPATGAFSYPFPTQNQTGDVLYKRLQVRTADLEAAQNAGARYFAEGHYLAADDAAAGNDLNNASYREIGFDAGYAPTLLGTTQPGKSALEAWRDLDSSVTIADLDVPDDGRFKLATRVVDLGDGTWRYEYALYNQNSHRSAARFSVPIAPGTVVTEVGFHDVDYHSGETYDDTDWTATVGPGAVTWATDGEATNANANALRFATTYNFWFEADQPPVPVNATVGLFRAGTPAAMNMVVRGPGEGLSLALRGGRFLVEASYRTRQGASGPAHGVQLTDDTGTFWFFNANNYELMVKALDGCTVNGHFWLFAAGLTNVEVTLRVTDSTTSTSKTYTNALGQRFQPILDTEAFASCP